MSKPLIDLTLRELAALWAEQRAALGTRAAEFSRIDAVCKLVATRLARFPEEKLCAAVAALRLKRGRLPPSGLLPSGTETIDRGGLLTRAREKFGVERTPSWLHNALKDRDGPKAIARDDGHWFYPRAEAEAWIDGLLSNMIDGRLPPDAALKRRRARERVKREEQYQRDRAERDRRRADRERIEAAGGIVLTIDPAEQFEQAVRHAFAQALPSAPPVSTAPNVVPFPKNDEPPGGA